MKRMKQIIAWTAVTVLLLAAMPIANAEEQPTVNGGTFTFVKELEMNKETDIPAAEMKFTIAAGSAAAYSEGKLAVQAGPVKKSGGEVTAPTVSEVSFTPGEQVTDLQVEGEKKIASKTVTVDFTGVTFAAPGVYRYVITEENATSQGVTNDTEAKRTVDVYVNSEDDGTLVIAGYVMYEGEVTAAPSQDGTAAGTKSKGYKNTYEAHNLTIGVVVKGNQASRYKYFAVTVDLENAAPGTKYKVDLSDASETIPLTAEIKPIEARRTDARRMSAAIGALRLAPSDTITQPSELTVGTDGKVHQVYYLRHDQSIQIKDIAPGVSYTAEEDPDDYEMSLGAEGTFVGGYTSLSAKVSGTMANKDEDLGFTNTRSGAIPTGVMLTIVPGVIIVGIAVAGVIVFSRKKKENE